MRVLVIGGNGFIGSSLVEKLRDSGHGVRVLDPGPPRADMDWTDVDYRLGSLSDTRVLTEAAEEMGCVFHLASSTVPGTSNQDPVADVESNLVGTLRLVQAMGHASVRRLVFFSSGGTVYGHPQQLPVPETHPLQPISSYGVVKVAIEKYLMMYHRLGVLDPLVLRPSNPYGPRQSTSGVQGAIGAFLGRAMVDDGVKIWGDGETVRDYIYVDDLVDFAAGAGLSGDCGIYNAGSGMGCSLNGLCELIREITDRSMPAQYLPSRDFDVSRIVLDISAASSRFGWVPKTSLPVGIARTWQALQSRQFS
jgi:UDP-glucose 4-epimerase